MVILTYLGFIHMLSNIKNFISGSLGTFHDAISLKGNLPLCMPRI